MHPAIQVNWVGYWETRLKPHAPRNYTFFGSLAGVRDDTLDPIFEPRGLPPGNAIEEGLELCTGDHTMSWFTLAEAKSYVVKLRKIPGFKDWDGVINCWNDWIADMEYCKKYLPEEDRTDDNVRVVFNFDS